MLPYTLERIVWRYLADEERVFIARKMFADCADRVTEGKTATLQQIADYAAKTGWTDAVLELWTCVNLRAVFTRAVASEHFDLAEILRRRGFSAPLNGAECAAREGSVAALKWILTDDVKITDPHFYSLFIGAASGNDPKHIEALMFLRTRYADPIVVMDDYSPSIGGIVLETAARFGCAEVVRMVLGDRKTWPHRERDRYGALFNATRCCSLPIIELLRLDSGVGEAKWMEMHGDMIAREAGFSGRVDVLRRLLDNKTLDIFYACLETAAEGNNTHAMRWLRECIISDGPDKKFYDYQAILQAIKHDAADALKLLNEWRSISDLNRHLAWAAEFGAMKSADLLLEWGATDIDGAFFTAAEWNEVGMLKKLKKLGASNVSSTFHIMSEQYSHTRSFWLLKTWTEDEHRAARDPA